MPKYEDIKTYNKKKKEFRKDNGRYKVNEIYNPRYKVSNQTRYFFLLNFPFNILKFNMKFNHQFQIENY